jgi:anti-sigma factor RsiW
MKKFLSTHLSTAHSLAGIAHEMLLETRDAAATKVSDLRSQVDELWQAAGDMLPSAKPAALMRRVELTVQALKERDIIRFPKSLRA